MMFHPRALNGYLACERRARRQRRRAYALALAAVAAGCWAAGCVVASVFACAPL